MLHNADFEEILRPIIRDYRRRSYDYWRRRIDAASITFGGCTLAGDEYQVEIFAFWDDKPGGEIRVCFAIDDGHVVSARCPYCEDLIISPDGEFVGE
jgi:hypothetical protein